MKQNDYPGTFIVIEGADGAGTTTQSKELAEELDAYWTSEPTGGRVGEKVEDMITSDEYSPYSIALAFAADRMLHLEEEVAPRLEKGEVVVSDRYYHSSLTYQSALGADFEWVKMLNKEVLRPDLTIIIDVDAEEAISRINGREFGKINPDLVDDDMQTSLTSYSSGTDVIFENLDFESKVIQRYRDLPESLDEEIKVVDGSKSIAEVFDNILVLAEELGN